MGSSKSQEKNSLPSFPFIPATKFLQISSLSNHRLSREALGKKKKKDFTFIPIATLKMLLLIACTSNELSYSTFKDNHTPESQQKKCSKDNFEPV